MAYEAWSTPAGSIAQATIEQSLEALTLPGLRNKLMYPIADYSFVLEELLYQPDIVEQTVVVSDDNRDRVPLVVLPHNEPLYRLGKDMVPTEGQAQTIRNHIPVDAEALLDDYAEEAQKLGAILVTHELGYAQMHAGSLETEASSRSGDWEGVVMYGSPLVGINQTALLGSGHLSPVVFLHEVFHVLELLEHPLVYGNELDNQIMSEVAGWRISAVIATSMLKAYGRNEAEHHREAIDAALAIDNQRIIQNIPLYSDQIDWPAYADNLSFQGLPIIA